jgi:hypothetical protein
VNLLSNGKADVVLLGEKLLEQVDTGSRAYSILLQQRSSLRQQRRRRPPHGPWQCRLVCCPKQKRDTAFRGENGRRACSALDHDSQHNAARSCKE